MKIMENKDNNKEISHPKQKSGICKVCEGNGYTIEVEGECCWDADYIERYGSCCGIPNPVQVQVECRKCQNGYIN